MPDQFVSIDLDIDREALKTAVFTAMASAFPGWTPYPGNAEPAMFDATVDMASDLAELAADVPTAIFRQFGLQVLDLLPIDDVAATASSTWTAVDNAGYTVRAGTQVTIAATGDDAYGFEVESDVVIPPGSTSTGVGEVLLRALVPGSAANGLTADPAPVLSFDWVSSIDLVGTTANGDDAESDATYLTRLRDELRLLTPRPILPVDFEVLARDMPGVWRALAIDGYNPLDSTTNNERTIALYLIDEDGEGLTTTPKSVVAAAMDAKREATFIVRVGDPTYTTINVVCTAKLYPGADPVTSKAILDAALADYLHPKNWGRIYGGEERSWQNTNKVRYTEIVTVVNNSAGIDYIETLTVNGGTADITMSGKVPLTRAGTITTTVDP